MWLLVTLCYLNFTLKSYLKFKKGITLGQSCWDIWCYLMPSKLFWSIGNFSSSPFQYSSQMFLYLMPDKSGIIGATFLSHHVRNQKSQFYKPHIKEFKIFLSLYFQNYLVHLLYNEISWSHSLGTLPTSDLLPVL